jgi:phenylalanyl-tRNA synthetase alpha chain
VPSPTITLSPSQLAAALAVRDLTEPGQGGHAIQLLVDAAVARLAVAWGCQVRRHRGPRVVPVEENYDRLRIPADAVSRDVRYTRYVDDRRLLRSHSTAMIPGALRALAADPADDVLLVCPGWCTGATPSTGCTPPPRTSSTCGGSPAGRSATPTSRRWSGCWSGP